jgi:phosphoglycolate phosphatase
VNILLDLDGTLTDPREGIVQCVKFALTALGEPCPSNSELEHYIGPPLQDSFDALFGTGSPKTAKAIDLYRQRFSAKGIFENKIYPEIPAALTALMDLGAVLIVATSKPTVFAEQIIEHFGLGRHIRAIYGAQLDGTRSDKRELISYILRTQCISPAATSMVGDRKHDMIGATANGVFAVGALWGYGSRTELVESGASVLCERPSELDRVLCQNNG